MYTIIAMFCLFFFFSCLSRLTYFLSRKKIINRNFVHDNFIIKKLYIQAFVRIIFSIPKLPLKNKLGTNSKKKVNEEQKCHVGPCWRAAEYHLWPSGRWLRRLVGAAALQLPSAFENVLGVVPFVLASRNETLEVWSRRGCKLPSHHGIDGQISDSYRTGHDHKSDEVFLGWIL